MFAIYINNPDVLWIQARNSEYTYVSSCSHLLSEPPPSPLYPLFFDPTSSLFLFSIKLTLVSPTAS